MAMSPMDSFSNQTKGRVRIRARVRVIRREERYKRQGNMGQLGSEKSCTWRGHLRSSHLNTLVSDWSFMGIANLRCDQESRKTQRGLKLDVIRVSTHFCFFPHIDAVENISLRNASKLAWLTRVGHR